MLRALRLLLIVHTIVAIERELDFGDYVITTDNDILKSIRTTGSFTKDLNLSNLGLVGLDKNAFDYNLKELLRLNLTNNWLTSIPEFVFSNLTNLEYLWLSDNNITSCLQNAFVGLRNLKLLDISKNHLTQLESNYFVGLTNSADILIDGYVISNMSTRLFEGTYSRNKRLSKVEDVTIKTNDTEEDHEFRVKVCYESRQNPNSFWVKRVDIFNSSELPHDCYETEVDYPRGKLFLRNLRTWKFDENWYGLQDFPINSIVLSSNDKLLLSNVTSVLNNLPQNIKEVNFSGNYSCYDNIELSRIENKNLRSLILENTCISNIDLSVFEKTNLTILNLTSNKLQDLKFLTSLTSSLLELDLSRNKIYDISPDTFSKLYQLVHLSMHENSIRNLSNQVFSGLSSLQSLNLANNVLKTFEPTTFQDLKNLRQLNLANNLISNISKGFFHGLDDIKVLDMSGNRFQKITPDTLYGLSSLQSLNLAKTQLQGFESTPFLDLKNLTNLNLANNRIIDIPEGSFTGLDVIEVLDMSSNYLRRISRDTLYGLSSLQSLDLARNEIKVFESMPFRDLKNLRQLNLTDNDDIKSIPKGFFTGLESIEVLDMTSIGLSKITDNTLYGLPDTLSTVILDGNWIGTLGNNSFVRVPKHTLSLIEMGIENITSGCFNLPRLQELRLNNNRLLHFSSWGNLKGLKRLFLEYNGIREIENGATANMGRLEILDLSANQIARLENGALFGLPKLRENVVRLNNTPIKLIQGGVFDHMHGN